MSRWVIAAILAALLGAPGGAGAQMSGAEGKPLQDGELPAGTVTIRVVRGAIEKPVSGVQVSLQGDDGSSFAARTDAAGRAAFHELETGVAYVGKATVEEKELETETFQTPAEGGLRFILSTVPLGSPGAAGPAAGDSDIPPIMRNPRRISGQARPESGDPAGKLTIRTVQGKFRKTEAGLIADVPEGAKVHLVGYEADGGVTLDAREVDEEGRVSFEGLATGGRVSYYALSLFSRGDVADRLMSQPVKLLPRVGMRMMLAGLAPESGESAADDLARGTQQPQPGPGNVTVRLQGSRGQGKELASVRQVELLRAGESAPVDKAAAVPYRPRPEDVSGRASRLPQPLPNLQEGSVGFLVFRMAARRGVPEIEVKVRAVEGEGEGEASPDQDQDQGEGEVFTATSGPRGLAVFPQLEKGKRYVATATVHGKEISGEPFEVPESGSLSMGFLVDWPRGAVEGRFSGIPSGEDRVYYARIRTGSGRVLYSPPFQLTEELGASVDILIYPQILFGFHGGGMVEDDKLWFELRLFLANPAETPLEPEDGGIFVPMPEGFVGLSVADEMSSRVKIDPDRGLIWRGALPPGQHGFDVSFALPVDSGTVEVDWTLPLGVSLGNLMLQDYPGMDLVGDLADKKPEIRQMQDGKRFLSYGQLAFAPGDQLTFTIHDLPQRPAWNRWLKVAVGLAVVACVLWAIFGVVERQRRAARLDPVRRQLLRKKDRLLDELVRIESRRRKAQMTDAAFEKDRKRLKKQLTEVFIKLGEGERPPSGRATKR